MGLWNENAVCWCVYLVNVARTMMTSSNGLISILAVISDGIM